jgi:hypothetical protein
MRKLLVPPIVVPAVLAIAILAYGLLHGPATPPDAAAIVLKTGVPVSK